MHSPELNLFVLYNGEKKNLKAHPRNTVGQVKQMIERLFGIPVSSQCLRYDGEELIAYTLNILGIPNNATLLLLRNDPEHPMTEGPIRFVDTRRMSN